MGYHCFVHSFKVVWVDHKYDPVHLDIFVKTHHELHNDIFDRYLSFGASCSRILVIE